MTNKYSRPASVTISAEEMEEIAEPFVIEVAGKQYALKSPNAMSLDDFGEAVDMAEADLAKIPPMLAYDKASEQFLRHCGIGIMRVIFEKWIDTTDVTLGESSSSDD